MVQCRVIEHFSAFGALEKREVRQRVEDEAEEQMVPVAGFPSAGAALRRLLGDENLDDENTRRRTSLKGASKRRKGQPTSLHPTCAILQTD